MRESLPASRPWKRRLYKSIEGDKLNQPDAAFVAYYRSLGGGRMFNQASLYQKSKASLLEYENQRKEAVTRTQREKIERLKAAAETLKVMERPDEPSTAFYNAYSKEQGRGEKRSFVNNFADNHQSSQEEINAQQDAEQKQRLLNAAKEAYFSGEVDQQVAGDSGPTALEGMLAQMKKGAYIDPQILKQALEEKLDTFESIHQERAQKLKGMESMTDVQTWEAYEGMGAGDGFRKDWKKKNAQYTAANMPEDSNSLKDFQKN